VTLASASLVAIPASTFGRGAEADEAVRGVVDDVMRGEPELLHVLHSEYGDIGIILIPVSDRALFSHPERALAAAVAGVELAADRGARTVSFTGMIPAGTDYGRGIERALAERDAPAGGWPKLTTGHAGVVASFLLNTERLLELTGRDVTGETAAFVGLGSIGAGMFRLLMQQEARPRSVILVDIERKRDRVEALRRELVDELGYAGEVEINLAGDDGKLPAGVYDKASLLLTATSAEEVIDVDALRPGALMVDDSFPLGFSAERAVERLRARRDILITIAGAFSTPGSRLTWGSGGAATHPFFEELRPRLEQSARIDDVSLTGCIYSSVLTEPLGLPFSLGPVTPEDSDAFYRAFRAAGFTGTRPYVITPRSAEGSYFVDDETIANVRSIGR
jgi:predicted amino acid dehydrogenase